jgi:hypothetical protein
MNTNLRSTAPSLYDTYRQNRSLTRRFDPNTWDSAPRGQSGYFAPRAKTRLIRPISISISISVGHQETGETGETGEREAEEAAPH